MPPITAAFCLLTTLAMMPLSRVPALSPARRQCSFREASTASTRLTRLFSSSGSSPSCYDRRNEVLQQNSKLSLAPMMEYTDRHFRHLIRLISGRTLLYSEMVASNAIAHERADALSSLQDDVSSLEDSRDFDPSYLLRFLGQGRRSEGASVLQLGGSDPIQMELAAKTVSEFNRMHVKQRDGGEHICHPINCDYTALNLNCGCPSPKVAGKGCFGAALMQEPDLVRKLTSALHRGSDGTMPVTVKCRIGTDEGYQFTKEAYESRSEEDEYQNLKRFVETVASDGIVTRFDVHARIAVLNKNYSPADNRKVPPLRYHHVYRLAEEFPELSIHLNGGIDSLSGAKKQLEECGALSGVMVGRAFCSSPWNFAMSDEVLYGDKHSRMSRPRNRIEVLEAFGEHADNEEEIYDPVKTRRFMCKAVAHLFAGEMNAKRFRIALDEIAGLPKKHLRQLQQNPNARPQSQPPKISELILDAATKHLSEDALYRSPEESYEMLLSEELHAERKARLL
mmetsp:Transcript_37186/g.84986  ORF Transcript_37186/g.84986 Transcript_37186/m.84986 type:complete len:509 (-) Transcript_37186:26-1552(-)